MNASNDQDWLKENALELLDAAVDAIITINTHGIIESVNSATLTMFGYERTELLGQPLGCLIPEPHRALHQQYIERYLQTGEARIIGIGRELLAQRGDGSVFPMSLAINDIVRGSEHHFAGIIRDLTEQKAALRTVSEQRDRLAQVGRLNTMGEMTASIAHEINQPLTAISMYAQASLRLLEQQDPDIDKMRAALEKLNTQALRAGAVIERIQRFVSNEEGQREPVDLASLVSELEMLIAADARLHSISLKFAFADNLPQVQCDPIQIQQVAMNLIRNSIDAIEGCNAQHGNDIIISIQHSEPHILLQVSDCGGGIPAAQQDKIFTAFHSTKSTGMGMGLSICRSIVEAHGGKLTFSNNDRNGCTFEMRLPLEDANE
ncbi:MAG: nitrogen regulation protein NR(II) [Pseudomonadales bacterium]